MQTIRVYLTQPCQLADPRVKLSGRGNDYSKMWELANLKRNMPPNLEILLYSNDKPRIAADVPLPVFSVATRFPAGSGMPTEWKHHVPFPSHFFKSVIPDPRLLKNFWARRPKVFFRGRFSENCWKRYDTAPQQWQGTPRFKLVFATRDPKDKDVLDIELTGFATPSKELAARIVKDFQLIYNITVGEWEDASNTNVRMMLAVSGNGWAGASAMRSFLSGAATLFVDDNTTDYEGYTRNLGELYMPLRKPDIHYLSVDYNNIAEKARELNRNPEKAFQISQAGFKFVQKFLGMDCALDVIELLAWRYYDYVKEGCPGAFSHVKLRHERETRARQRW